jgi:hypothetical protein
MRFSLKLHSRVFFDAFDGLWMDVARPVDGNGRLESPFDQPMVASRDAHHMPAFLLQNL